MYRVLGSKPKLSLLWININGSLAASSQEMFINVAHNSKGVYMRPTGRTSPARRDQFPNKNCLLSHGRRASPTRRDLAIDKARSRLVRLEIFHVNATGRAGPPSMAE